VLAEQGFVLPEQPINAPKRTERSVVYYRHTSKSRASIVGDAVFGSQSYQVLTWQKADRELRRGGRKVDVAVVIGQKAALQLAR
jgi:hypothetical protein